MSGTVPASFCWFDYETFGTSPVWDRPSQFAAIRTDASLEPLGEPEVIWCRQSDDYLPHPGACRVTGITPEEANRRGVPEHRFIERVRRLLGAPGTCSVGYNSVRFDDEFTRHTLFRNLHDPYAHEYKDGASRWDLLDVVRLVRALRPDGIVWPQADDGRPSNRLEDLSAANGLEDGRAHDALVDVRATIALARLIRARQPRLFDFALAHRGKAAVARLLDVSIDIAERRPVVLVSPGVPATRHHLALVLPLVRHPDKANAVIVLDLARDPAMLAGLDSASIAERVFARGMRSDDPGRPGLHVVATNKCPVVAPETVLRASDAERLGIDLAAHERHREVLLDLLGRGKGDAGQNLARAPARAPGGQVTSADLPATIQAAMARPFTDDAPVDVDASLYAGGFLSGADRARLDRVRATKAATSEIPNDGFDDARLVEMVFRYRARNYPDTLDTVERKRWRQHVETRLGAGEDVPWLSLAGFERAMHEQDWREDETGMRDALSRYAESLSCPGDRPRP